MKRVVITGLGINCCLGNTLDEVSHALKHGISGVKANSNYAELNFKSQVSASAAEDFSAIDRRLKRFMSVAAGFAYLSAKSAIEHANLTEAEIANNPRYGVVGGTGGASTATIAEVAETVRVKGTKKVGPFFVPRNMSNTVSANLSTALKLQGVSHSISSACATSADAIGYAASLIAAGKQDLMLAGGGDQDHWSQSVLFDAMGALSSKYNDSPQTASRPYSADRDGFVIAGGGGILVLESLEHAQQRNAPILAELVGYATNSDGSDMVALNGEGSARCIQMAWDEAKQHQVDRIDYINTHATSTPAGDIVELNAIKKVFADQVPPISSTKSMTGHSLGASGVHEAIYCLLMMQHGFIAPSINITELDPGAEGFDIVQTTRQAKLNAVLSNSFGFGGTNSCLIFKHWS